MKPRILLVSSDKALAEDFQASCGHAGVELERAASAEASRRRWSREGSVLLGVVADAVALRQRERQALIRLHAAPGAPPLVLLDPPRPPGPKAGAEGVARLSWPLEEPFPAVPGKAVAAPLVFLCDQTLYLTGLLLARLQGAGLQPAVMGSAAGLAGVLSGMEAAGGEGPARCVVVRWKGDVFDAELVASHVRASAPSARFYLVSSRDPVREASAALRRRRPAFLPRPRGILAVDLLSGRKPAGQGPGRILLVDDLQPSLAALGASLMEEGYEVAACARGEEALEAAASERFDLAVVGAAAGAGRGAGTDLVQKLRKLDGRLRFILTLDGARLQTALETVSRGVEEGFVEDCLLKPVEPSRLHFSIRRALERRRLAEENERLLAELKSANHRLAELGGFQKQFFATVAHDVRNPLAAVIGYADLLLRKLREPEPRAVAERLRAQSRTLASLISDLVDFAAIESGKLRVQRDAMDLGAVVQEVLPAVEAEAQRRGLRLDVRVPESLPRVLGDPLRVGQVLQSLCANAVQYTPEGGTVSLEAEPGPSAVTVSVRDTGIGIAPDDLPRVFENFYQAPEAQRMRGGGFGLGLKIAQEILRAHGSAVEAESVRGRGSVFRFALPLAPQPRGRPAP